VTLQASKIDPFQKGINLTIAASYDNVYPVCAMKQYLARDTYRAPHKPLFCIGRYEERAFTWEYVILKLQPLAIMASLGQGMWVGHSFRRPAATWVAEVGISESKSQTFGRWRSDAYKRYIEYSSRERISLSKRFQVTQQPTH